MLQPLLDLRDGSRDMIPLGRTPTKPSISSTSVLLCLNLILKITLQHGNYLRGEIRARKCSVTSSQIERLGRHGKDRIHTEPCEAGRASILSLSGNGEAGVSAESSEAGTFVVAANLCPSSFRKGPIGSWHPDPGRSLRMHVLEEALTSGREHHSERFRK